MSENKDLTLNTEEKSSSRRVPFAVVEAYKTIRTNLSFLQTTVDTKIVAFSSPEQGDGKSTTAVNVAIAFAQLGKKTLLIDADLRRGSVHKKLKIESKPGLSNVLANMISLDEAVNKTSLTLDVLTAGRIPPNPSEMLGSTRFAQLLEEAKQKYDHIIIDTPPINIVSDALIVGGATGGLVLVVREGVATSDAIEHAIGSAKFADIDILGVVLNGVNAKKRGYRYYNKYKYKYGYRYGYKSTYEGKSK